MLRDGFLGEENCRRCQPGIERENVYSPVSLDGQNRTQIGWCMINQGAETHVKHVKDGKGCGFSSNIISRGLVLAFPIMSFGWMLLIAVIYFC